MGVFDSPRTFVAVKLLTRYFSIFGWYWLVFHRYHTNRYQWKTWLVDFGITNLVGAPFSLKKGGLAPFLNDFPWIFSKKESREIFKKSSHQLKKIS